MTCYTTGALNDAFAGIMSNTPLLKNFRRIVVKVGSSLLVDSSASGLKRDWLASLAADVAGLHRQKCDVLVVSSGAIALGRAVLKLPPGALKLEDSQAAAAVGQIALARAWSEALGAHSLTAGQVLVLRAGATCWCLMPRCWCYLSRTGRRLLAPCTSTWHAAPWHLALLSLLSPYLSAHLSFCRRRSK